MSAHQTKEFHPNRRLTSLFGQPGGQHKCSRTGLGLIATAIGCYSVMSTPICSPSGIQDTYSNERLSSATNSRNALCSWFCQPG